MSSVLLTLFSELADPRRGQGKMYPLAPILLFTVLAMLAGTRSYRQVHAFMQTQLDRLNSGFGLSLRRAPADSSVRFILRGRDVAGLTGRLFTRDAMHCQKNLRNSPRHRLPPAGPTEVQSGQIA